MKKFNLRKKILALTLTAMTMFSTVAGLLPGGIVHAAEATSGTYYEEVVIPTPEVVPTPKPSATTTIVVPEPIVDNTNSVVPDLVVDNTDTVNLPNIVATAPGENIQSDVTKIDDTVNKNILSKKPKQNDEKITDFSKNSDKDNKKIDPINKKPSEEKDTAANIIKENKSSQKTADMIMGISFLLVLIIVAIITMIIRFKSKKEQ